MIMNDNNASICNRLQYVNEIPDCRSSQFSTINITRLQLFLVQNSARNSTLIHGTLTSVDVPDSEENSITEHADRPALLKISRSLTRVDVPDSGENSITEHTDRHALLKISRSLTRVDVPNSECSVATSGDDGGLVDVHASDGGRVSVQSVKALSRLGVPDFESSIRGSGYDDMFFHLRRPDAARVTHQSTKAFTGFSRPNL